jgi:vacuolar-type H+-ATPase subunit I/STV1
MLVESLHIHMAATTTGSDPGLDWISRGMLIALNDNGNTGTTTEIKTLTGVTEGTKVPYRLKNTLAPAGLVDLHRPGMDENGRPLPMEATLTDEGEAVAEELQDHEDQARTPDIGEYADQLNAELTQLRSRVNDLEEIVQDRQQIDGRVADSLEELDSRLTAVEQESGTQNDGAPPSR